MHAHSYLAESEGFEPTRPVRDSRLAVERIRPTLPTLHKLSRQSDPNPPEINPSKPIAFVLTES